MDTGAVFTSERPPTQGLSSHSGGNLLSNCRPLPFAPGFFRFCAVAASGGQNINGHSMTGELVSVMVCPPDLAGWNDTERTKVWEELGYLHQPDFDVAREQHGRLCRALTDAGARVVCLRAEATLSLDAVYAHDASFPTDFGVVLLNPGKKNRVAEAVAHEAFYSGLGASILGS